MSCSAYFQMSMKVWGEILNSLGLSSFLVARYSLRALSASRLKKVTENLLVKPIRLSRAYEVEFNLGLRR